MEFTLDFVHLFAVGLFYTGPLLLALLLIIVILGHFIGKIEGWSKLDALYHSFITATTVGYGDIHPSQKLSKILAVIIAFIGIVFTGIVVAVAIHSATLAFENTHDAAKIAEEAKE
ncbi:MAG: potassium channel family protein [Gammaproteobacteria bacterium]|nr:potassium channel family protein [Gammaproteobacteria bacterium]